MSTIVKNVAIIGAGPGGLATAIALQKQGINVKVYEKAKEFRQTGAGLGLTPNGINSLLAINPEIVQRLKKKGCCVTKSTSRNHLGEIIRATTSNTYFEDKFGQPLLTIWWYFLQQVLVSFLPKDKIHMNHHCIDIKQNDNFVEIYFENGKTAQADLLVGVDGVKSMVRKRIFDKDQLRYLGSFCWRAVVKNNKMFIAPNELVFVKDKDHFMYLLNLGGQHISWIIRKLTSDYEILDSTDQIKTVVLKELEKWGTPIKEIIEATEPERILQNPICDLAPLNSWSKGRVVLLGDAAHPMGPALAQGTNSTFEDALVLSKCLEKFSSIEKAFITYEDARISRVTKIQNRSAEGEKGYYQVNTTNQKQPSSRDTEFDNWLYGYKFDFSHV